MCIINLSLQHKLKAIQQFRLQNLSDLVKVLIHDSKHVHIRSYPNTEYGAQREKPY